MHLFRFVQCPGFSLVHWFARDTELYQAIIIRSLDFDLNEISQQNTLLDVSVYLYNPLLSASSLSLAASSGVAVNTVTASPFKDIA